MEKATPTAMWLGALQDTVSILWIVYTKVKLSLTIGIRYVIDGDDCEFGIQIYYQSRVVGVEVCYKVFWALDTPIVQ